MEIPRTSGERAGVVIQTAAPADLPAINDIYNHYVLHSTSTYQLEVETIADRMNWFERHSAKHPVIVARLAGTVVGWGSLSPFHSRRAFENTVEDSVYVRHDFHGRGIGSQLLGELMAKADALGHRTVIAGIDAEQAASVALHLKHGFEHAGRLQQVGFKFGRWLDVIYMQKMLSA